MGGSAAVASGLSRGVSHMVTNGRSSGKLGKLGPSPSSQGPWAFPAHLVPPSGDLDFLHGSSVLPKARGPGGKRQKLIHLTAWTRNPRILLPSYCTVKWPPAHPDPRGGDRPRKPLPQSSEPTSLSNTCSVTCTQNIVT